jgi:uncharacterized RDD family membrane protein YckC
VRDSGSTPVFAFAGFGQRVGAYLLDGVILTVVGFVFAALVGFAIGVSMGLSDLAHGQPVSKPPRSATTEVGLIIELLFIFVAWAYFAYFWKTRGATPGQRAMQIRVVDSKSYGSLSARQSIVRFLGYVVSALVIYVGFIWAAFDSRKQGWHDKLAGTVVIKIRKDDMGQSPGAPTLQVSVLDEIKKLGELREAGVVTEAEFQAKKTELLGRI